MSNKTLSRKEVLDGAEVQIVCEVAKLLGEFRKKTFLSDSPTAEVKALNDRIWALLRRLDSYYNPGRETRTSKEVLKTLDLWLFVRNHPTCGTSQHYPKQGLKAKMKVHDNMSSYASFSAV